MNALAVAGTPGRRFEGAGRVSGLGRACAFRGGATTTKTIRNEEELALPAEAGGAYGAGRWSDEPMRRPDHKAKKHGRPVREKHRRRKGRQGYADLPDAPQPSDARMTSRDVGLLVEVTQAAKLLGVGALTMAVTLTVCWPLRHQETIFAALAAL